MDLGRWWRDRRWAALLEYIDQLPATSRLNEAIHNDPDQAVMLADRPEPPDPWAPALRDWSLTNAMLGRLIEAAEATAALLSGAEQSPRPFPTPVTAVDRIAEQRSQERQLSIIALATPHALL